MKARLFDMPRATVAAYAVHSHLMNLYRTGFVLYVGRLDPNPAYTRKLNLA